MYTVIKFGGIVLKESIGSTIIKLVQMVLKGVKWVHNDKIKSNGLERSQLGTQ